MRKVLGLSKSDFNSIAREIQEIKRKMLVACKNNVNQITSSTQQCSCLTEIKKTNACVFEAPQNKSEVSCSHPPTISTCLYAVHHIVSSRRGCESLNATLRRVRACVCNSERVSFCMIQKAAKKYSELREQNSLKNY